MENSLSIDSLVPKRRKKTHLERQEELELPAMRKSVAKWVKERDAAGYEVCDVLKNYVADLEKNKLV